MRANLYQFTSSRAFRMPPRRSSRAPSVAAEPAPAESLPTKRKRGQTAEPAAEEKENIAKPASRTRRSTSAKPPSTGVSNSRKSIRSKVSLPNVVESENEDQSDAPPPVKKARPSVESREEEDVKAEEGEEESVAVKPRRGRRAASVAKAAPVEMDVDADAPSKPASRRTSTRTTNVSTGSRTSIGSAKSGGASGSAHPKEVEEDEDGEEEDVKPVKGRRAAAKPGQRATAKVVQSDDEEAEASAASEYDEEEDVKPTRRGRKPKAPVNRKGKAPVKKATKTVTIEDSDSDTSAPPSAQPRAARKKVVEKAPTPEAEPEEEEEEQSLFEPAPPPSIPVPSTLPQIPEEPAGPKSRLVIHKMALVNFKSYAGRQEIGPFHKVSPIVISNSTSVDSFIVFLFNCGTQWIWKIKHYRCVAICFWLSRLQNATRQDLRVDSQFCKLSGP